MAATWEDSFPASGDFSGSVKPICMSTTSSAGRAPKPIRFPKPLLRRISCLFSVVIPCDPFRELSADAMLHLTPIPSQTPVPVAHIQALTGLTIYRQSRANHVSDGRDCL